MDQETRGLLVQTMLRNHGPITVQQAAQIGITSKQLATATRRGELSNPRHRVYTSAAAPDTWRARMAVDLAATLRDSWAAYTAALRLHDAAPDWLTVHRELVAIGSGCPIVRGGVRPHRTTTLPEIDRTTMFGIPTTTVERAVIDLGRRLSSEDLLRLVDHVVMTGAVDRDLLHARAKGLSRGRTGVSLIADATADDADRTFRSELERAGLALVIQAGLRDPQVNVVPLQAPDAGETDIVSEVDRVIVDWDGLRFHAGPDARQRDDDKGNAAAIGGYTHLRFTWGDVYHRPSGVVQTVYRLLLPR